MRASPRPLPPELQPYLVDAPHPRAWPRPEEAAAPASFSWREIFGNDNPVEIEVGFGKGMFLLNQSQARPETNFLGVEIERKYTLLTASRLAKRQIANVRLVCTDAHWLLRARVADRSVAAMHVYFPDPWWKKRHHKRRLFTPEFALEVARTLQDGGQLHFVSDVREYFDETIRMLAEQGRLQPMPDVPEPGDYLTNFERKYRQEGRAVHRALYCRGGPHEPEALPR